MVGGGGGEAVHWSKGGDQTWDGVPVACFSEMKEERHKERELCPSHAKT